MHVVSCTFVLAVVISLLDIYSATTTESPLSCAATRCVNGGTCQEPAESLPVEGPFEVEGSGNGPIGNTTCDCPPFFYGDRCEDSDLNECGKRFCDVDERCLSDNTTCVETMSPVCRPGVHEVSYSFKKRDTPAVCLNMFYTNSSSFCHDNDSSIEFSIGKQDEKDFFYIMTVSGNQTACLQVNMTFRRHNFPGGRVHNVTLIAEENVKTPPRNDTITFSVTFNTAPIVNDRTKIFYLNQAASNEHTINVPQEFGVFDIESDKLKYTVLDKNSRYGIDDATGIFTLQPGNLTEDNVTITIQDDGIPSLKTEVTVTIKVLYLKCQTQERYYVDYNKLKTEHAAIGKIKCDTTDGRNYSLTNTQEKGIDIFFNESMPNDRSIWVRNGSLRTYTIEVNIILYDGSSGSVNVNVSFTVTIGEILTASFRMVSQTWNPDLADVNTTDYITLKNKTEHEITVLIHSQDIQVDVKRFRNPSPGSVYVFFTLLAPNKNQAGDVVRVAVGTGNVGIINVDDYKSDDKGIVGPSCQTDIQRKQYSFRDSNSTTVVCLDTYYTNTTSPCYDNDSSISFTIREQNVTDFFYLAVRNETKPQTCLEVNSSSISFPPVQHVTLTAEEVGDSGRSAVITFSVTFNTAPSARDRTRDFYLNKAFENNLTVNVRQDFSIFDSEYDNLNYSLTENNSRYDIDVTTGIFTFLLGNLTEGTIESITFEIQDNGIPSLGTEVTAIIKVINLKCQTKERFYVDYDKLKAEPAAIGKIKCASTNNRSSLSHEQTKGIDVFFKENDRSIWVRNGLLGTYTIKVTVTDSESGSVNVTVNFSVTIGKIMTASFQMVSETWRMELAIVNTTEFDNLRNKIKPEIEGLPYEEDIQVHVKSFRNPSSGSVYVFFTLLAPDKDQAGDVVRVAVGRGNVGIINVADYKSDGKGIVGPRCQGDVQQETYSFKKDKSKTVVCLDTYYTKTTSPCYDNDSSISFTIREQNVTDFFYMSVRNETKPQTCLKVKPSSTNVPVQDVTLIATEAGDSGRSDVITFRVTFNTAPTVGRRTRTYYVNKAVDTDLSINVPQDFSVSDKESDKLTYNVTEGNPTERNASTGIFVFPRGNKTDDSFNIMIEDDGIPSLKASVKVLLKVLNLKCQTKRQLYVDYDSILTDTAPIGTIQCVKTKGYDYNLDTIQSEDIQLEFTDTKESDQFIWVRNGALGTFPIQVTIALEPLHIGISVTVNFTVTIGELRTGFFKMVNETWNSNLDDVNSNDFIKLKNITEREIEGQLGVMSDVLVTVTQFGPGSVYAYFTLLAKDKDSLANASNAIEKAVVKGNVGIIPVKEYNSFEKVGLAHLTKLEYKSTNARNHEGATINNTMVELKCAGSVVLSVGAVTVEWTMTDRKALIVPLPGSRLQIDTNSKNERTFTSVLTLDPILSKDTGPFTCNLKDEGGHSASKNLFIRVIAPPVLTLTPIRQAFINASDSVTLICNVTEPRIQNTNLTWYIGGEANTTEVTDTSRRTVNGKSLKNDTYYCQGSNDAGEGDNSTVTTVFILPENKIKQCPLDRTWEKTIAAQMSEALCPDGETGTMTRKCNLEGVWLPEDRSQCVSNKLNSVFNDIGFIAEGVQVNDLSTVAKNLSDESKPETLETKEIELVLDSLEVILETARDTNLTKNKTEIKELAKGFVNTVSNPIDEVAVDKWNQTSQNNTDFREDVLDLVDDLTSLVSESLSEGENVTVESPNIVLQVSKTDPNDTVGIQFPDGSEGIIDTNITSSVKLEAETILALAGNQSIGYSFIYYKNITAHVPEFQEEKKENSTKTVNSGVWSVNIFPKPSALNPPLTLNFTHINKSISDNDSVCAYLDTDSNSSQWRTDHCNVTKRTKSYTVCSCYHLTNFALLMKPTKTSDPGQSRSTKILSTITIVGCSISIFFLTLTIIIFASFWKEKDVKSNQSILLMHICVFLALAMLLFIVGVQKRGESNEADIVCKVVAVFLHFLYLLVFFMMLAAGLDTLLFVLSFSGSINILRPLLIGGWVLPLVIVVISLAVTQSNGYGTENYCWLSTETGLIWAFIGPILFVVFVNFIIIGMIVYLINHVQHQTVPIKIKKALRGIFILIPVLGVSWVFGVLTVNDDQASLVFQYIFAVLNSLQGLFIFITQCFINRKLWNAFNNIRRKFRSRRTLSSEQRDTRSSQRRDGRSRQESQQNLLHSQSASQEPVEPSEHRVPDSPKYSRRADIHRRENDQETYLPDEPPRRDQQEQRLRGTGQAKIPEEESGSVSSEGDSESPLQRYRQSEIFPRAFPEEPPQENFPPQQTSGHFLGYTQSAAYQTSVPEEPPQRILSPERSPNPFSNFRPSDASQTPIPEKPPQRMFHPEQSLDPFSGYRQSRASQTSIPNVPPQRILLPEQSLDPFSGHTPSDAHQRSIPENPPQMILPTEQSLNPFSGHTHSGAYKMLQPEKPSKGPNPFSVYRPTDQSAINGDLPQWNQSAVQGPWYVPARQGHDNQAYRGDELLDSNPQDIYFDFTQDRRDTQTGMDNGFRDRYDDAWSDRVLYQDRRDVIDDMNPFANGGHMHTAYSPYQSFTEENPYDNMMFHSPTQVQGVSPRSRKENESHDSLSAGVFSGSPFYQMMEDQGYGRPESPRPHDNRSPKGRSKQYTEDSSERRQNNSSPVDTRGHSHLDFVPFGVRADTQRLSGAAATSPFLHPGMFGTMSHDNYDAMSDRPFTETRRNPPTSTLKKRNSFA